MRKLIAILCVALTVSGCSDMFCGAPMPDSASVRRFGPAVPDEKTALRIARAMWRSMDKSEESEAEWLKSMSARPLDGLWFVSTSTVGLGGGLGIYISPEDGRIVELDFYQ